MELIASSSQKGTLAAYKKWLVLIGTGISGIVIGLDLTIVNASLVSIQHDLNADINQLQWIMAGFGLMFCAFLVTMGRCADIKGHKKILNISLIGFAISSVAAGMASSCTTLISMRIVQGFFGSAILPCSAAITANSFIPTERGRALGIYSSLIGIGIGFGPIIGGVINEIANWRWIFYINAPITLISVIISWLTIDETKFTSKTSINFISAILLSSSLGSLCFVITEGEFFGWNSHYIWNAILVFIISTVALIIKENKAKSPIVPLSLFKNKGFLLGIIIYAGAVAFHWPILFIMPIYLQNIVGYSIENTNLLITTMTAMTVISPFIAGYLYDRKYKNLIVHVIFALNMLSFIMFLSLSIKINLSIVIPAFVLFGLAWGIGNGIATPIALSKLESSGEAGVVSGALTTILNVFAVFTLITTNWIHQFGQKKYLSDKLSTILSNSPIDSLDKFSEYFSITKFDAINGTNAMSLYKNSFIYGMDLSNGFLIICTFLCWILACIIMSKLHKP